MKKREGFLVHGGAELGVRVQALEMDNRALKAVQGVVIQSQKANDLVLQAVLDHLGIQQAVMDQVRETQLKRREADLVGGGNPLDPAMEGEQEEASDAPEAPGQDPTA